LIWFDNCQINYPIFKNFRKNKKIANILAYFSYAKNASNFDKKLSTILAIYRSSRLLENTLPVDKLRLIFKSKFKYLIKK